MKFQTLDEVRDYVAGSRIQCLVCGKQFGRLARHVATMHDLTPDAYREMFGIPWSISLTSAPSRAASRAVIRDVHLRNLNVHLGGIPGKKQRPHCPAVQEQWAANAELGRDASARQPVVVPCTGGCGTMLHTTKLTAVQPIYCDNCASPGTLKARRHLRRKKLRDLGILAA